MIASCLHNQLNLLKVLCHVIGMSLTAKAKLQGGNLIRSIHKLNKSVFRSSIISSHLSCSVLWGHLPTGIYNFGQNLVTVAHITEGVHPLRGNKWHILKMDIVLLLHVVPDHPLHGLWKSQTHAFVAHFGSPVFEEGTPGIQHSIPDVILADVIWLYIGILQTNSMICLGECRYQQIIIINDTNLLYFSNAAA